MEAKANHSVKTSPQPRAHGPAAGELITPTYDEGALKKEKKSLGERTTETAKEKEGRGWGDKEEKLHPKTRNNKSNLKEKVSMAKGKIHRDNTITEVDRRKNSRSLSEVKDIYFTEVPKAYNSSSGARSPSAWPRKPEAWLASPPLQPSPLGSHVRPAHSRWSHTPAPGCPFACKADRLLQPNSFSHLLKPRS